MEINQTEVIDRTMSISSIMTIQLKQSNLTQEIHQTNASDQTEGININNVLI